MTAPWIKYLLADLLSSAGLKRKVAALLNAVLAVAGNVPQLQPFIPLLQSAAAFFGVTGIAHAAQAGTLADFKASSLSALLSVLVIALPYVPALRPYQALIQSLAATLGAYGVAAKPAK